MPGLPRLAQLPLYYLPEQNICSHAVLANAARAAVGQRPLKKCPQFLSNLARHLSLSLLYFKYFASELLYYLLDQ